MPAGYSGISAEWRRGIFGGSNSMTSAKHERSPNNGIIVNPFRASCKKREAKICHTVSQMIAA